MTISDAKHDTSLFPPNQFDGDGQQVDLRKQNTWSSTIEDVISLICELISKISLVEVVEVHAINAIAPFILNSKLKPLLLQSKAVNYHVDSSD
jgi:hypothetical protein